MSVVHEQLRLEKNNTGFRPYRSMTPITTFADANLTEFSTTDGTSGWRVIAIETVVLHNDLSYIRPYNFYKFVNEGPRKLTGLTEGNTYYFTVDPNLSYWIIISADSSDTKVYTRDPDEITVSDHGTDFSDSIPSGVPIRSQTDHSSDGFEAGAAWGMFATATTANVPYSGNLRPFLAYRTSTEDLEDELDILVVVSSGGTATTIVSGTGGLANAANTTNPYRFKQTRRFLYYQAALVTANGGFDATASKLTLRLTGDNSNRDILVPDGVYILPIQFNRAVSKGDNIQSVHGLTY